MTVPDPFGCAKQIPLKKRILSVVLLNRVSRVLKPTRVRLHSAAAGAAFALIAGLSAPAAAASIGTTHTTHTTPATTTAAHASPATGATAAAPAAAWKPTATDLHTAPVAAAQESLAPTAEQIKNARAIMD